MFLHPYSLSQCFIAYNCQLSLLQQYFLFFAQQSNNLLIKTFLLYGFIIFINSTIIKKLNLKPKPIVFMFVLYNLFKDIS